LFELYLDILDLDLDLDLFLILLMLEFYGFKFNLGIIGSIIGIAGIFISDCYLF